MERGGTLERMHDAIPRRGIFTSSCGRGGEKRNENDAMVVMVVVVVVWRYDVGRSWLKRHTLLGNWRERE